MGGPWGNGGRLSVAGGAVDPVDRGPSLGHGLPCTRWDTCVAGQPGNCPWRPRLPPFMGKESPAQLRIEKVVERVDRWPSPWDHRKSSYRPLPTPISPKEGEMRGEETTITSSGLSPVREKMPRMEADMSYPNESHTWELGNFRPHLSRRLLA